MRCIRISIKLTKKNDNPKRYYQLKHTSRERMKTNISYTEDSSLKYSQNPPLDNTQDPPSNSIENPLLNYSWNRPLNYNWNPPLNISKTYLLTVHWILIVHIRSYQLHNCECAFHETLASFNMEVYEKLSIHPHPRMAELSSKKHT